jgi:hypothetical protein
LYFVVCQLPIIIKAGKITFLLVAGGGVMSIVFEWMLLEILLTIAMLQMNHHLDEGCHWQRERRMGTKKGWC